MKPRAVGGTDAAGLRCKTGQLLDATMPTIGNDAAVACTSPNVIKCRLPGNRNLSPTRSLTCALSAATDRTRAAKLLLAAGSRPRLY